MCGKSHHSRVHLFIAKLTRNSTCEIIGTMVEPSKDDTTFFVIMISHDLDAPSFDHPLDVHRGKM